MKVLFVSAGDREGNPREVVKNQGLSLIKSGVQLRFFCIAGRGVKGYLKSLPALKREIASFKPDIVHAHYSFSGFVASLAGAESPVVSLMGSEASAGLLQKRAIRLFSKFFWGLTIVKTPLMAAQLRLKKAVVLPNGVNTELFRPESKSEAAARLGWSNDKTNVIFVADPGREEKNFTMAEKAVSLAGHDKFNLVTVHGVPNRELVWYYNAADILLLTSLWEGSPNVVKEAMACGCQVVSTGVGDVRWITGETEGTWITSNDTEDIAEKLRRAAEFAATREKTDGRERIFSLGLDSVSVSEKIIRLYESQILLRMKNDINQ